MYTRLGATEAQVKECQDRAAAFAAKSCKKGDAACLEQMRKGYFTWFCERHTSAYMVRFFNPKNGSVKTTKVSSDCVPCLVSELAKRVADSKMRASAPVVIKGLGGPFIPMNQAWDRDMKSFMPPIANDVRYHTSAADFIQAYERNINPEKDWVLIKGQVGIRNVDGKDRRSIVGEAWGGATACEMLDTKYPGLSKKAEKTEVPYLRAFEKQGYDVRNSCLPFVTKGGTISRTLSTKFKAEVVADINKLGHKSKWFFFNRAWFVVPKFDDITGQYEWGPDATDRAMVAADKAYALLMTMPPSPKAIRARGEMRNLFAKKKQEQNFPSLNFAIDPATDIRGAITTLNKAHKSWGDVARLPLCSALVEDYRNQKAALDAAKAVRDAKSAEDLKAAQALSEVQDASAQVLKDAGFSLAEANASVSESNKTDQALPDAPISDKEGDSPEVPPETGLDFGKIAFFGALAIGAVLLLRKH